MTEARIFGIGSPFAEDDSGWRLAEVLVERGFAQAFAGGTVEVLTCATPQDLLLGPLEGLKFAVILDTVRSDEGSGRIRRIDGDALCRTTPFSSHGLGVAEVLALGDTLRMLPPCLEIYGIDCDGRTPMPSPSVLASEIMPILSARIREVLGRPPPSGDGCEGADRVDGGSRAGWGHA